MIDIQGLSNDWGNDVMISGILTEESLFEAIGKSKKQEFYIPPFIYDKLVETIKKKTNALKVTSIYIDKKRIIPIE